MENTKRFLKLSFTSQEWGVGGRRLIVEDFFLIFLQLHILRNIFPLNEKGERGQLGARHKQEEGELLTKQVSEKS